MLCPEKPGLFLHSLHLHIHEPLRAVLSMSAPWLCSPVFSLTEPQDGEKPGLPGVQGVPEQSLWSDQHGFLSVTCWPQPSSNWL